MAFIALKLNWENPWLKRLEGLHEELLSCEEALDNYWEPTTDRNLRYPVKDCFEIIPHYFDQLLVSYDSFLLEFSPRSRDTPERDDTPDRDDSTVWSLLFKQSRIEGYFDFEQNSDTKDNVYGDDDWVGHRKLDEWKRSAGKNKSWKCLPRSRENSWTPETKKSKGTKEARQLYKPKKARKLDQYGFHEAVNNDFQEWADAYSELIYPDIQINGSPKKAFEMAFHNREDWKAFLTVASTDPGPFPESLEDYCTTIFGLSDVNYDFIKSLRRVYEDLFYCVHAVFEFVERIANELQMPRGRSMLQKVTFPLALPARLDHVCKHMAYVRCLGIVVQKEAEALEHIYRQMQHKNESEKQVFVSQKKSCKTSVNTERDNQRGGQGPREHEIQPRRRDDLQSVSISSPKAVPKSECVHEVPKNYKFLPQSAKRRLRKRRQKAKFKPGQPLEIAARQEKHIADGTSPYTYCHGLRTQRPLPVP
ncbi:hypothetical protein N0V90_002062 [Kalmusia sp. IMI 367209]|nr:hypothetical protein N0V90_002062 [Kalmusia sp. IMI 367209]